MDFIALDVETANPDLSSICQLGIAVFSEGRFVNFWQSLVNPEDEFDEVNMSVHGITGNSTRNAPTFPQIAEQVRSLLSQKIVATHTAFDKMAIDRVVGKYGLTPIDCVWLDTAKVTRRAWPKFRSSGYGLKNVADELGIKFKHHEAQEDARAAGEILLQAIAQTGISLNEWLTHANQPISSPSSYSSQITREGNPNGPLAGEVIVFTGALSLPRKQAADLAAQMGCAVKETVNKTVTLLVVGDQDIRKLAGQEKSTKHRKAEELISKGQPIRILKESDFIGMVNQ